MDEVSEIISTQENENDMIRDFRPPPDVTDLATVLKTEENSTKKEFVVRKGTAADIFNESENNTQFDKGKYRWSNHRYVNKNSILYTYNNSNEGSFDFR